MGRDDRSWWSGQEDRIDSGELLKARSQGGLGCRAVMGPRDEAVLTRQAQLGPTGHSHGKQLLGVSPTLPRGRRATDSPLASSLGAGGRLWGHVA